MPVAKKRHRQSVSLPPRTARRVKKLAKTRRMSTTRVIEELIHAGLDAKEAEKAEFLALAERFASCDDPKERKRLKKQLAILTFGE